MESERRAALEQQPEPITKWLGKGRAKLLCILSAHVDDLKGAAPRPIAESLLRHLESHFGKCKAEWDDFMHTGIRHVHQPGVVERHQHEYISALRPMTVSRSLGMTEDSTVDGETHSSFMTLLGGCAWAVLSRADLAVYIQALQRRAHQPRILDCKRLNTVVRYMQRHPGSLVYRQIAGPTRLVCFSDSAFKAQDGESSGLALRSLVVLLAGDGPQLACSGRAHMLDFVVRRLKRVVRSTFAAELNALIDGVETALLTQMILHQVRCGTSESPEQLLHRMQHGCLDPGIDVFLDAQSVFDALAAADVSTPLEASLKIHIISLRDRLRTGTIRNIAWADTRDMLADGLNKGGVARGPLQAAMAGNVTMSHNVKRRQDGVSTSKSQ